MTIAVEGIGQQLTPGEATTGSLYTGWMVDSAVLCLGIQHPIDFDAGHVLILAGDRIPPLSIVTIREIAGPRIAVEGALVVRPFSTDESAVPPVLRAFPTPQDGDLAVLEGIDPMVILPAPDGQGRWCINLNTGKSTKGDWKGAVYIRAWEMIERTGRDDERVLARFG